MRIRLSFLGFAILICLAFAGPALASEEATAPAQYDKVSTLWVLFATTLVFFMQAGFSMVEAGMIRAKNAANVLMKNLLDFSFASLGYYLVGYALMYGGGGLIIGTTGWLMLGAQAPDGSKVPLETFWLFQAVFAGTTATIVAGAVAERMRFLAYLTYSFLISALVYPIVGHWVWGGGWLADMGFHDFAGSTVVHGVGGVTALLAAWMLGPRIGRFNPDGTANVIGAHNLPLATLGVFILWFGWFGFNAGSTLSLDDLGQVSEWR